MKPFELTLLITLISNYIANDLSDEEIGYLSVILSQFLVTLDTITIQRRRNLEANAPKAASDLETTVAETERNIGLETIAIRRNI